jgi:hypothetical protein
LLGLNFDFVGLATFRCSFLARDVFGITSMCLLLALSQLPYQKDP